MNQCEKKHLAKQQQQVSQFDVIERYLSQSVSAFDFHVMCVY